MPADAVAVEHPVTERDSLDFRDRIYAPALHALPERRHPNPDFIYVRDQGSEGACTGFGLAAVIDYLSAEHARDSGDALPFEPVSARMLYEMAQAHDRWPGSDYQGSSARASMKGWHKNGVCREATWSYRPGAPGALTEQRQHDALARPLGAYYRVLPRRADLFAALAEVSAIFVTARIHAGWEGPSGGVIPFDGSQSPRGGHAFAVIGYNEDGFIVQNSWGRDWGGMDINGSHIPGVALWLYADFEATLWDAWVARRSLPVKSLAYLDPGRYVPGPQGTETRIRAPARDAIQHHYIHIDDGGFDPSGDYPSTPEQLEETLDRALDGTASHLLLYAHGGLNSVKGAAARAGAWRPVFRENDIHEIHFIWETGLWAELRDVLLGKEEFARQRAGGISDWTDTWIEHFSQPLGYPLWQEMLSDAAIAFEPGRAGTHMIEALVDRFANMDSNQRPRIHLCGHSAGSVWLGHLLTKWRALEGPNIDNLVLLAPACTHAFFDEHIRAALARHRSRVERLHHFLLSDEIERDDDVFTIYRKSLLYLVSRSFQRKNEIVPLMGMKKHLADLPDRGARSRIDHYVAMSDRTQSHEHGQFDDDVSTMNSLLEFVLGGEAQPRFESGDLKGY